MTDLPIIVPMYIVEAFTIGSNQPFTGNTAAICVIDFDDDITDKVKQHMGMQMNYSETAFISKGWDKSKPLNSMETNHWTLRWFTPKVEIDLCGYATLAASYVVFNEIIRKSGVVDTDKVKETTVVYETKYKGTLEATMNWSTGLIALNFPANVPIPLSLVTNNNSEVWLDKLLTALLGPNVPPDLVDDVKLATDIGCLLIRLRNSGDPIKNRELLTQIQPNFTNLLEIKFGSSLPKIIAVVPTIQGWTELGADKPQFYSRTIAPWVGNDEDPVCGAAHTMLTPYWLEEFRQQGVQFEDKEIVGLQLSERKGEFLCSMEGENDDRVKMVGQTRLTFSGEFYLSKN